MFVRLVGRLLLARKERTEGDAIFEGPGIGASPDGEKEAFSPARSSYTRDRVWTSGCSGSM